MNTNPMYSVRFLLRTDRAAKEEVITAAAPLRVRVWIASRKEFLYLSTPYKITRLKWMYFRSDGTPRVGADPSITRIVDGLRAAVGFAVNYAIATGQIDTLTSDKLKRLVDSVAWMMQEQEEGHRAPIVGTRPTDLRICQECAFRGTRCRAPWPFPWKELNHPEGYESYEIGENVPPIDADNAADFAAFLGECVFRYNKKFIGWQPSDIKRSKQALYLVFPYVDRPVRDFVIKAAEEAMQQEGGAE